MFFVSVLPAELLPAELPAALSEVVPAVWAAPAAPVAGLFEVLPAELLPAELPAGLPDFQRMSSTSEAVGAQSLKIRKIGIAGSPQCFIGMKGLGKFLRIVPGAEAFDGPLVIKSLEDLLFEVVLYPAWLVKGG